MGVSRNLGYQIDVSIWPPIISALFIGSSYGFFMGSIYYYLDKKASSNMPLWLVILYQTLISMITLAILLSLGRIFMMDFLIELITGKEHPFVASNGWPYLMTLSAIFTLTMTVLISFINQMNRKFGPGILIPMILGRFRKPKEETRVFMFLDLKNSTGIAEELGNLRYSSLISDCFSDINSVIPNYLGEIYQYVGDEIVISWDLNIAMENNNCLQFFFAQKDKFQSRSAYYQIKYGLIPEFKAGMHLGNVTLVEVGDIKRDLAYHGDAINVASRIQNLCKALNKSFLISEAIFIEIDKGNNTFKLISQGEQLISGRKDKVLLYAIELS